MARGRSCTGPERAGMSPNQDPIDPNTVAEIEETVDSPFGRLSRMDTITKDDLDEFRRALPTDPMLAEFVERALPFPWSELFEYVGASDHLPAHWRTSHDRSAIRSADDREHKQRFAEAAREARGLEGTVERNGREIPASATHVAEKVSGETTEQTSNSAAGRRALRRLRQLLRR